MTSYVTEIYHDGSRERPELQILHKLPMEAEADKPASPGPRPDQHPREDRSMSTSTLWAPTRDELDQATARTADAIALGASPADRQRAAELEEVTHMGYLRRPGADAELQREAEREWEAGG